MSAAPGYAELHCLSNFSFQRRCLAPEELVARAAALGYSALAITDECSVAGLVRAHAEADELGLQLLPGAEFALPDGSTLVALPHNLDGWGNLCEAITQARRAAPKGRYQIGWDDLSACPLPACELLLVPPFAMPFEALHVLCTRAGALFGARLWLGLTLRQRAGDGLWQQALQRVAGLCRLPLVAAGGVADARALAQAAARCARRHRAWAGRWHELWLCPAAQCRSAPAQPAQRLAAAVPGRTAWPTPWWWPNAAVSAWTSCATSTPMESVLPGLSPSQTLRQPHPRGRGAAGTPAGLPPRCRAAGGSTSWR